MNPIEDSFAREMLPPRDLFPDFLLDDPRFIKDGPLNAAAFLLDQNITKGHSNRPCLLTENATWTYQKLFEKSNQIARVLREDLNLKAGNRVLLRAPNNPMLVACWFGVLKAGGIVVTTMPLLTRRELNTILDCAQINFALCDARLQEELNHTDSNYLKEVLCFDGTENSNCNLEEAMATKSSKAINNESNATDIALIGFTSGTTGKPKMTAHYHRDLINICEAFPPYALKSNKEDVFTGSPPIGFTFGLGGLVLFPMHVGASSFLMEKPAPEVLLKAIEKHSISICFTAPTAWRNLTLMVKDYDITSLRKCISAGECLPEKIWSDWHEATGLKIIDGIGATEMLHIFIASSEEDLKPGATGKVVPGYEAKILTASGKKAAVGKAGWLAVRGITGCRYLNRIEKQRDYVVGGWNLTGDTFKIDEDGFYWYISRNDDMIISSGYNIAAVDVENVLLCNEKIRECAVVGLPDEERGNIVCAHIVLKDPSMASEALKKEIQDWYKKNAAPHRYPRKIYFQDKLPKTQTGKTQRFRLKEETIKIQPAHE